MRTYAEITASIYQHGPLDWDELANRAGWEHVYDPANPVTMTADQAMILLECRDELIRKLRRRRCHIRPALGESGDDRGSDQHGAGRRLPLQADPRASRRTESRGTGDRTCVCPGGDR